jgi:hypothetical protein
MPAALEALGDYERLAVCLNLYNALAVNTTPTLDKIAQRRAATQQQRLGVEAARGNAGGVFRDAGLS